MIVVSMRRLMLWSVVFAACAPPTGVAKRHVITGYAALRDGKHGEAARAFDHAKSALAMDPDESAAEGAEAGLAEIDRALLAAAVDTESILAGDDLVHLEALHRLHVRLLQVGGDPQLEPKIIAAMQIRASLALQPHEATTDITDISDVIGFSAYPELGEEIAKRVQSLSVKAWQAHMKRVADTRSPLVRRVHEGLAARQSGAALPGAEALARAEISRYSRGSKITATVSSDCEGATALLRELEQPGAYQVDANVHVSECTSSTSSVQREESETYFVDVPTVVTEQVPVHSCTTGHSSLGRCVSFTSSGCAVLAYAPETTCSTTTESRVVTRYIPEPRTRRVMKTHTLETIAQKITWTQTFQGVTTESTTITSSVLEDGQGTSRAVSVMARIRTALDAPIDSLVRAKRAELLAESDRLLAAGLVDEAEAASVRALLLGAQEDAYWRRRYFVSGDDVRAAMVARRESPPAAKRAKLLALPERKNLRAAKTRAWLQDRFAATFPPALSQIRSGWYNADLGVVVAEKRTLSGVEAAGDGAPIVAVRLGTPLLSRLRSRALGAGVFDDFSITAQLGYALTGISGDARKHAFGGGAQYTLTAGYRSRAFAALVGARATVHALRISGTKGTTWSAPFFAHLSFGIGHPSLAVEAWGGSQVGSNTFGAMGYYAYSFTRGVGDDYTTGFFGLRFQQERFDACGEVETGACMDIEDLRIRTYVAAFGVAFH